MNTTNRQFHLVRIPSGPLMLDCFRMERTAMPEPKEGEVLLKALYISIDAANRAWMQGATYRDALGAGTVMAARGVGEVIESRHPDFTIGDLAFCDCGWQDYAAVPGSTLLKQRRMEPLSQLLRVYGVSGLTAYFGLHEVARPNPGETVVISAAAGAVGSFAGQIAKRPGCRTVGIAGGDEKCRWLTGVLGYDAAVNYKARPISESLKAACPNGIDVYFDNVGGEILEAGLSQMNLGGASRAVASCPPTTVHRSPRTDRAASPSCW